MKLRVSQGAADWHRSLGHAFQVEDGLVRILILDVVHGSKLLDAAVTVAKLHLVERLGPVEALPVACAHLVSVQVALSAPAGPVPHLAVLAVSRGFLVECFLLKVSIFHAGARWVAKIRHLFLE